MTNNNAASGAAARIAKSNSLTPVHALPDSSTRTTRHPSGSFCAVQCPNQLADTAFFATTCSRGREKPAAAALRRLSSLSTLAHEP
eukprot:4899603-Prymnesium_polylepis.1